MTPKRPVAGTSDPDGVDPGDPDRYDPGDTDPGDSDARDTDGEGGPLGRLRDLADDDPRLQAGLDHLQRAAREMIAASRALLDVAEDLVEDPRSVGGLVGLLGSVGDLAARAARPTTNGRGGRYERGHHDGDDGPPVQRIPVS